MTEPRDWDREIARIDRAIASQPPTPAAPPGTGTAAAGAGRAPAELPAVRRRSVAATWFQVLLGLSLAAALVVWPYAKTCGLQLAFYLGAVAATLLAGAWSAVSSWTHRRGVAHLLSLLAIAVGAVMAAREVLPRVGYARETRTWLCPRPADGVGPPAPPGPAVPGPTQSS